MTFWQEAQAMYEQIKEQRRDLHRHPETGWTEFRTASIIVKKLTALGLEVHYGKEVMNPEFMMGVPSEEALKEAQARAISEGADPELVEAMTGGMTGVVGIIRTGRPGKTVAARFDMDCNDVSELQDEKHVPFKEGFSSLHKKEMHACGHDGHVSIGLAVAELLSKHKDELCGTIKLIFQPAEEGVRGAYAMAEAGVVDDVDYFFGGHVGFIVKENDAIAVSTGDFLATTKLDAEFTGVAAHAGAAPEEGRNALLAAAQAAISLNTISRHSNGASRINVGVLNAGTGRNVVPNIASMKIETRGANDKINTFMVKEAERMLQAAADLYGVGIKVSRAGSAPDFEPNPILAEELVQLVGEKCQYSKIIPVVSMGGSEDCASFMSKVVKNGGQASYMIYGTSISAGHHSHDFNFNEDCLWKAAATVCEVAAHYSAKA